MQHPHKILYFIISMYLLVFVMPTKAQTVDITTDERAELISIVGRLSQFQEYSQGSIKAYNNAIDSYFAEYKTHPITKLAQEYRKEYGLSYDAMMWVALHIDIRQPNIVVNEHAYNNLPDRWTKERLEHFVNELSFFYQQTKFHEFYKFQEKFYEQCVKTMADVLENKVQYSWFKDFWGAQAVDNFHIIISLTNGPSNYGIKTVDNDKNEKAYAVLGCGTDDTGTPFFDAQILISLIVHEINHSFDKGTKEITEKTKKESEIIHPLIAEQMNRQAYNQWQIIIEEATVRAGVICYMQSDTINNFDVNKEVKIQQRRSFFWIDKLVEQLNVYRNNRSQYPTIKDFAPQIIQVYKDVAEKISAPDFCLPHVAKASLKDDSIIPTSTNEIIFTFNKPMLAKGYGLNPGVLGNNSFPKIKKIEWIDNMNLRVEVDLEADKEYSISMYIPAYSDLDGFPMQKGFDLKFKTQAD